MHPLRGLLQPRPIVDGAADHQGLVAPEVLDGLHRSGLGLLSQLPELLGDALRDSLGRSVLTCVSDEYAHLCSLLWVWSGFTNNFGPIACLPTISLRIPWALTVQGTSPFPLPSVRTTTLQGSSRPMSGSCSSARCASWGLHAPRII